MSNNDIGATYEKMYLHEEEIKNSLAIKTQVIFTAIFALVSTTIYLARFLDFSSRPDIALAISLMITLVVTTAMISTYFNFKAFSGSEFKRMPYAAKVKDYYDEQIQYNIELDRYNAKVTQHERISLIDPTKETENFISNTYVSCSTHNALANEKRSRWLFQAIVAFLLACIPLAFASLLFVLFDMDTSSPRKNFATKDAYVGGEIASLKNHLLNISKNNDIAELERRIQIIESGLSERSTIDSNLIEHVNTVIKNLRESH